MKIMVNDKLMVLTIKNLRFSINRMELVLIFTQCLVFWQIEAIFCHVYSVITGNRLNC